MGKPSGWDYEEARDDAPGGTRATAIADLSSQSHYQMEVMTRPESLSVQNCTHRVGIRFIRGTLANAAVIEKVLNEVSGSELSRQCTRKLMARGWVRPNSWCSNPNGSWRCSRGWQSP
jgi:hypothetical protein